MRGNNLRNNQFMSENLFVKDVSNRPVISQGSHRQKIFINGLQNARKLLNSLERSLHKTSKYEKQLLRCKASHSHLHDDKWCDSDFSEEKQSKCSKTGSAAFGETGKPSRSRVNLAESWSTMSIVCLQYQYEELSKRYESLLRAYDERCGLVNARDAALAQLRQRAKITHAHLAHAHKILLAIGDKYLALRDRRLAQKSCYEKKIERLKRTLRAVMEAAERARAELDAQVALCMVAEQDSATALLLAEIRKCNHLFLENIRLKAQAEEPAGVSW